MVIENTIDVLVRSIETNYQHNVKKLRKNKWRCFREKSIESEETGQLVVDQSWKPTNVSKRQNFHS